MERSSQGADKENVCALRIQHAYQRHRLRCGLHDQARRCRVVREIISTERTFVDSLTLLQDVVIRRIRAALLSHTERNGLFGFLEPIIAWHQGLLVRLQQALALRADDESPEHAIARQMRTLTETQSLYKTYALQYANVHNLATDLIRRNPYFASFIRTCEEEKLRNTLSAFLILPVQRPPRYHLLMKELLRYTQPRHPDHKTVRDAGTICRALCEMMNAEMAHSGAATTFDAKPRDSQELDPASAAAAAARSASALKEELGAGAGRGAAPASSAPRPSPSPFIEPLPKAAVWAPASVGPRTKDSPRGLALAPDSPRHQTPRSQPESPRGASPARDSATRIPPPPAASSAALAAATAPTVAPAVTRRGVSPARSPHLMMSPPMPARGSARPPATAEPEPEGEAAHGAPPRSPRLMESPLRPASPSSKRPSASAAEVTLPPPEAAPPPLQPGAGSGRTGASSAGPALPPAPPPLSLASLAGTPTPPASPHSSSYSTSSQSSALDRPSSTDDPVAAERQRALRRVGDLPLLTADQRSRLKAYLIADAGLVDLFTVEDNDRSLASALLHYLKLTGKQKDPAPVPSPSSSVASTAAPSQPVSVPAPLSPRPAPAPASSSASPASPPSSLSSSPARPPFPRPLSPSRPASGAAGSASAAPPRSAAAPIPAPLSPRPSPAGPGLRSSPPLDLLPSPAPPPPAASPPPPLASSAPSSSVLSASPARPRPLPSPSPIRARPLPAAPPSVSPARERPLAAAASSSPSPAPLSPRPLPTLPLATAPAPEPQADPAYVVLLSDGEFGSEPAPGRPPSLPVRSLVAPPPQAPRPARR